MARNESKEMAKTEPTRMLSPFDEMERPFEDFFRRPFSLLEAPWFPKTRMTDLMERTPSVDIIEEGDNIVVKAELPGMKKDEIDVKLTDNMLIISGEKQKETKEEGKNFYRLERSHGTFRRTLSLPAEVDFDISPKSRWGLGVLVGEGARVGVAVGIGVAVSVAGGTEEGTLVGPPCEVEHPTSKNTERAKKAFFMGSYSP